MKAFNSQHLSSLQRLLLLAAISGTALALRATQKEHYANDAKLLGERSLAQRSREIETEWRRLTYTPLLDSTVEAQCLARLDWSILQLSDLQKEKLTARLSQVLRYLAKPDFEVYYAMKTDGLHYLFGPQPTTLLGTNAEVREPSDRKAWLRAGWDKFHVHDGAAHVPRLDAVCISSFVGAIGHTNSGKALLNGKVKKGMTIAVESLNPGFSYQANSWPAQEPVLFEFSFFAKAGPSGNVGPLHISLLWLDQDQDWAINRLIADQWLHFRTFF